MKHFYVYNNISEKLNSYALLFFFGLLCAGSLQAQVREEFEPRVSENSDNKKIYNVNGDFTLIGNSNLTLQFYNENRLNSNNTMVFVDTDNNDGTDNSSSAELTFSTENGASSECSNVVYAGLYWTGRANSSVTTNRKRSIKFRTPNGNYQDIIAAQNEIRYPGDNNMYVGYSEVTDLVKNSGAGEYWVADIALSEGNGGSTGYYGGWGMVVVYENALMNPRDVTIFDGYAYVRGNATEDYEIDVEGFNTAQDGDINIKLGLMAGEGDRGISGDYFEIKKRNNQWQRLSHDQNSNGNFFNSSINTDGDRNPDLVNNTGLDISMFNVPNQNNSVIGNNQSEATFRYGTTQDTYIIYSLAMSVDAYQPKIEGINSIESINGQPYTGSESVQPGDEITYKVELRNKGSEDLENVKLVIPLPYNGSYVENSGQSEIFYSPTPTPNSISFNNTLGATGSVVWNLGDLPTTADNSTVLAEITLKIKVTEDCDILKFLNCSSEASLDFKGSLNGKGKLSGVNFENTDFIQGFDQSGACDGQPITRSLSIPIDAQSYIEENCSDSSDRKKFKFCDSLTNIPVSEIRNAFPSGTRFYDSFPIDANTIEYTTNNPFPVQNDMYNAIVPGTNDCFIPFEIEVESIDISIESISATCDQENGKVSILNFNLNYNYTLLDEDGQSIQQSINSAGMFTNLSPGTYSVRVDKGSCSKTSEDIAIANSSSRPDAPVVSATVQPTCETATGSFTVSTTQGFTYSIGGDYQESGSFTGLAAGTYNVTAKNTDGCESQTTSVVIQEQPNTPDAPVVSTTVQPTCETATGSFTVNTVNGLQYSIGGDYQTSGSFTGLSAGTYQVTARNADGCVSTATSVTINQQPNTPDAPVVSSTVQPTCETATGSFTVNTVNGLQYSIGGDYQTSGSFTDLAAGTYNVTAKNTDGCLSTATSVVIQEQPNTPDAPVVSATVQPTCETETGSITVTTAQGFTYSINGTDYQSSGSFTGLAAGTYNVTAKNADGCISPATSVVIQEQPNTPDAPVVSATVQPTCETATGSFTVNTVNGLQYSIGGDYQTSGSFTDLAAGTYNVTAKNADGCISPATSVVIQEQPNTPDAPVVSATVQPTCETETGSFTVTTVNGLQYSIGGDYQTSGSFTGLTAGTYNVTAKNADGCISPATSVVIQEQPNTPDAPVVSATVQPTCETATGSFTVNTVNGLQYSIGGDYQTSGSFTGLAAGTYNVTAKNADGCISTATSVVIQEQPNTPDAPVVSATVQPTCETETGSFTVTTVNGLQYSIGGDYQSSGSFTGLTAGTYNVTAKNADGCISPATSVVIQEQPNTPDAPVVSATVQPTCETATGSITVTTAQGFTYSINGTDYQSSGSFTGLAAGTYNVTAKNADGCISPATSVVIQEQPNTPDAPVVSATVQPTCETETGSFTVTTVNGLQYSIGGDYQSSGSFTGLTAGTYNVTAKNADGCISPATSVVIQEQPNTPDAPVVSATVQSTCETATGSIIVTTVNGLQYSIGGDYQTSGSFTGLAAGTYNVTAKNADGCISTATSVTINQQPIGATANNDAASTNEDNIVTINVLANDTNPGDGNLTIVDFTQPGNGSVTKNDDDTFEYTPNENYNGEDTFSYTITNGECGNLTATVTITINPVNDAPVAVDDSATTSEDTPVQIEVLNNDSDPDGDELTVTEVTQPGNGTAVINTDGTVTYTPNENFNGTDTFTYTISDGNGGTDTATVTVTIGAENDAPVAVDDSATTSEDTPVQIDVLDNDSDPDGDELTITEVTQPGNGIAVINTDGTVTYTPNENFNGTDTFTYTISDGNGGTDTATVT
uniref:Ig-like domain-containing protein n=1 Tax=uncultured Christiangramia sp. TaxID=503836 RepID=UPI002638FEED